MITGHGPPLDTNIMHGSAVAIGPGQQFSDSLRLGRQEVGTYRLIFDYGTSPEEMWEFRIMSRSFEVKAQHVKEN